MANERDDPDDPDETELVPTEFWMLECWTFEVDDFLVIDSYPEIEGAEDWDIGIRFETDVEIEEPIRLEWDPHSSGPKLSFYKPVMPLFRKEIVAAMREAGVDNIDCYRAEIRDAKTGEVDEDYIAVNIVGLVSAADLSRSESDDPSGTGMIDMDFDSLAIDEQKARGFKMFRLAESTSGIVIHRTVKEHLESKGGFGLVFVHPSEWIG